MGQSRKPLQVSSYPRLGEHAQAFEKAGSVFFCVLPPRLTFALPLAGPIPPKLGCLSALRKLQLFNNKLTGSFSFWTVVLDGPQADSLSLRR